MVRPLKSGVRSSDATLAELDMSSLLDEQSAIPGAQTCVGRAGRARAGGTCLRPTRARRSLFTGLSAIHHHAVHKSANSSGQHRGQRQHSNPRLYGALIGGQFFAPACGAQRCGLPICRRALSRLRSCCLQAPIVWPAGKAGSAAGVGAAAVTRRAANHVTGSRRTVCLFN